MLLLQDLTQSPPENWDRAGQLYLALAALQNAGSDADAWPQPGSLAALGKLSGALAHPSQYDPKLLDWTNLQDLLKR